jgi:mannose-6-phosphate isomerase-like protein (cupin superfamily)
MITTDIAQKFGLITTYWDPKVIGELNGQQVKIAKLLGEFVWHSHAEEDELFYVVKGTLILEFRDRQESLTPGQFIIVPKGVEHRPVANEEVWVMLFEPIGTINTGNVEDPRRRDTLERL